VPPPTLVTSVPDPGLPAGSDNRVNFDFINKARGDNGFGLLAWNDKLAQASADHTAYMETNRLTDPNVFSHTESAAYPGFTGVTGDDRAKFRGYTGYAGEELTGNGSTQTDSINALFSATYHQRGFLSQSYRDVGLSTSAHYTIALVGKPPAGPQLLAGDAVAMYPCNGITVNIGFHTAETPHPVPSRPLDDFGYPIYATVRLGQTLAINSWTLKDATGAALPILTIIKQGADPNGYFGANEATLLANARIPKGGPYTTELKGTNNGVAFTKTCTFSVAN
jgi:uncharacterized protein YraI